MNKNIFYLKYGLNHNRLKSLLLKYGISDFNTEFKKNKNLENILNQFLDLNLEKKEIILKKNHLIMSKQINNGSISGYKRLRGFQVITKEPRLIPERIEVLKNKI